MSLRRLSALGLLVMVTVTSAYEAGVAVAAGADSLVVQGPAAGGHRGTFAPDMEPGDESLHQLIDRIGHAHRCPAHRGGRAGHRRGRRRCAAQGSGGRAGRHRAAARPTKPAPTPHYRAALKHPQFTTTVVTRAFSGRYARGLENEFTRLLDQCGAAGLSRGQPDDGADTGGGGRGRGPERDQPVGGHGVQEGTLGPAADIVAESRARYVRLAHSVRPARSPVR